MINSITTNNITNLETSSNQINNIENDICRVKIGDIMNNSCSICLDDFHIGSSFIQTRCNHIYHLDCIKKVIQHKKICPLCNADIKEYLSYKSNDDYQTNKFTLIKVKADKIHKNSADSIKHIVSSIFVVAFFIFCIYLLINLIKGSFNFPEPKDLAYNITNSTMND
jgi:SUMO ligase MMS21 Smc5/6 complex component